MCCDGFPVAVIPCTDFDLSEETQPRTEQAEAMGLPAEMLSDPMTCALLQALFRKQEETIKCCKRQEEEARCWREDTRHRDKAAERWQEDRRWQKERDNMLQQFEVSLLAVLEQQSYRDRQPPPPQQETYEKWQEDPMQMTEAVLLDGACTQPNLHAEPHKQCSSSSETTDDHAGAGTGAGAEPGGGRKCLYSGGCCRAR